MVATTRHLVEESSALAGYTQSDEITLLFHTDDLKAQVFLDRRIQKLTSILASMATGYFNAHLVAEIPERAGVTALFDCRVWAVPTPHEAIIDRTSSEMQEMLFQKGINWNDYPPFFKRGTYVLRRKVTRRFAAEEIEAFPPKHAARTNPELVVTRGEVRAVELPPLGRVINRVGVLFEQEEPWLAPSTDRAGA